MRGFGGRCCGTWAFLPGQVGASEVCSKDHMVLVVAGSQPHRSPCHTGFPAHISSPDSHLESRDVTSGGPWGPAAQPALLNMVTHVVTWCLDPAWSSPYTRKRGEAWVQARQLSSGPLARHRLGGVGRGRRAEVQTAKEEPLPGKRATYSFIQGRTLIQPPPLIIPVAVATSTARGDVRRALKIHLALFWELSMCCCLLDSTFPRSLLSPFCR